MRKASDYKPITNEQQTGLFSKCLPQGMVWNSKGDKESTFYKLLLSLSTEINALEEKIYEMVVQWNINDTLQLISEWEIAVGIPDECRSAAEDIITRRSDVLDKLKKIHIITIADYGALAESVTGVPAAEWDIRPGSQGLLDEGLVGHWKMNGDSIDSTANGNDGSDTTMSYSTGKISLAGDFDGADSKINIASPAILDNIFVGGGSICGWLNASTSGEGTFGRFLDKTQWYCSMSTNDTTMRFVHTFTGTDGIWTFPVPSGQYNNICVVYDNSSVSNIPTIYVNNLIVVVTQVSIPTGTADSDAGSVLYLGNRSASDFTFDGQIDDVRAYNKLITDTVVSNIYNGGAGTEAADDPLNRFVLLVSPPTVTAGAFSYPFGSGFESGVSLTRVTNVVTATVTDTSTMVSEGQVVIAGAVEAGFNGTFTVVSIPTGNTFTYASTGVDVSATGTITVTFGIDQAQIVALAANTQYIFDAATVFPGYPFAGSFRTDILKCVFRKVTPANVVIVFD